MEGETRSAMLKWGGLRERCLDVRCLCGEAVE